MKPNTSHDKHKLHFESEEVIFNRGYAKALDDIRKKIDKRKIIIIEAKKTGHMKYLGFEADEYELDVLKQEIAKLKEKG
jgi:hypothetical protein